MRSFKSVRDKRLTKEIEKYEHEGMSRGLPALQLGDNTHEIGLLLPTGHQIKVQCDNDYPFRAPRVQICADSEWIGYHRFLVASYAPNAVCAYHVSKMVCPGLFSPNSTRWPSHEDCICCTSILCDAKWTSLFTIIDIVAEAQFWTTYADLRRILPQTRLQMLPDEIILLMAELAIAHTRT